MEFCMPVRGFSCKECSFHRNKMYINPLFYKIMYIKYVAAVWWRWWLIFLTALEEEHKSMTTMEKWMGIQFSFYERVIEPATLALQLWNGWPARTICSEAWDNRVLSARIAVQGGCEFCCVVLLKTGGERRRGGRWGELVEDAQRWNEKLCEL